MKELVRGERVKLADLGLAQALDAEIRIVLPGSEIDYSVFGLDTSGRLSDDRYMVFYNQPSSPCGGVKMAQGAGGGARFSIDLARVPASVARLTIAATVDGQGTMRQAQGGELTLAGAGGGRLHFALRPSELGNERALMVADLYRKDGAWRLCATAQGFAGGLAALIRHFGGEVADDAAPTLKPPPAPAPAPAPAPPRVSLEKKMEEKAPHLVSLAKKAQVVLEKRGLLDTVCQVGLVLDASGSMFQQYTGGKVQEVVERIFPLAVHFDDDGAFDTWAFSQKSKALTPVSASNLKDYVNREWGGWRNWMANLNAGINYEPAVIRHVIHTYGERALQGLTLPAYVIFISDGGVGSDREIEQLLVQAAAKPIFWQFVGIGGDNYGILERFDTMPGRKVDNCNFFALDDLHSVDEKELYSRLLAELPDWLKAARAAGVLR